MADTELVVPQSTQLERRPTFAPRTINEAFQFAEMLLESGMTPKSYAKLPPSAIVVALQFGMEVGLAPLQALQNIANINGQPSLWGDAALALCKSYPNIFEYIIEQDFEAIKKQGYARCRVKRRGEPEETIRTFSLDDAKQGGLLGRDNVWKTYPARMMQMRARAFALRDTFPDVLKGLAIAEEVNDYVTMEAVSGEIPGQQQDPQPPVAEPIGAPGATAWWKTYSASGWTREDSDAFLLKEFGIDKKSNGKDSRDIPRTGVDGAGVPFNAVAMAWANTPKATQATEENMDAEPA